MARIGVCLSGCGVNDGSEIHESVITTLALDRAGAEILYTAPDMEQTKVVNHLTGDEMNENRNVLVESARIARGEITDIANLSKDDMDGLLFPGGFGAALNLCDFALKVQNAIFIRRSIVSTPAYMLANNISEAASGIEKLVQKILSWT